MKIIATPVNPARRGFLTRAAIAAAGGAVLAAVPTIALAEAVAPDGFKRVIGDNGRVWFKAEEVPEPIGSHPDAKIFDLVEEYIAAERRWCDACLEKDRLDGPIYPAPEVLRIRPRDLELGRKPIEAADEYWHRPIDMRQWRVLDEWQCEKTETDDCMTLVSRRIPASDELKARGAEIVTAFDAWSSKRQRGYVKAEREAKRANRKSEEARNRLCEARATTLEGMRAKLRSLELYADFYDIDMDYNEPVIVSLFEDLVRMTDRQA